MITDEEDKIIANLNPSEDDSVQDEYDEVVK